MNAIAKHRALAIPLRMSTRGSLRRPITAALITAAVIARKGIHCDFILEVQSFGRESEAPIIETGEDLGWYCWAQELRARLAAMVASRPNLRAYP